MIKVSSVQLRCLARRILNLYADFLSFAGDVNRFMITFYTGDDTQEAELKQCRSRSSHGTSILVTLYKDIRILMSLMNKVKVCF